MRELFYRKYSKVLEVLPDVAACAQGKLILVGGTALALFHLKHRISIDLDFVPVEGDDRELKEALKGCLKRRGYRALRAAYANQFVIQFEDTSIKIEVFTPEKKVGKWDEHSLGAAKLSVASLDDILEMKKVSYADRKEARDLFDIAAILRHQGEGFSLIGSLIRKHGAPRNLEQLRDILLSDEDYSSFTKVISDAAEAGD